MKVGRRQFLLTAGAAAVGAAAQKLLPAPALAFHPDAFDLACGESVTVFSRFDVLYGWSVIRPEFVAGVFDDDEMVIEGEVVKVELVDNRCDADRTPANSLAVTLEGVGRRIHPAPAERQG